MLSIRENSKVPDKQMLHGSSTEVAKSDDSRTLGYPDQRKLVRTGNRTLLAAYRSKDKRKSGSYQIYVSRSSDNGTSWQTANGGKSLSLQLGSYDQRVPDMVFDGGVLFVTWYGANQLSGGNNEHQIFIASSSDGGNSFSSPESVGIVSGYDQQDTWQEHPVLFADNGKIYITWEGKDRDHEHPQVKISSSADRGKSWRAPANINPDPALSFSRPGMIRQGAKLWLFCYKEQKPERSTSVAVAATSDDGGAHWTEWQQLSNGSADSRHVTTTLDRSGTLFAAFRVYDNGKSRIAYRTVAMGSNAWTDQKYLPAADDSQFFPSLGTFGGRVYVSYSLQGAKEAKAPKEDLADNGSVQLAAYDEKSATFKTAAPAAGGSWLTLARSGQAVEGLSEKPEGGTYGLVYTRFE